MFSNSSYTRSFICDILNASFVSVSLSSLKTNSLSQVAIFVKCYLSLSLRSKKATYLSVVQDCPPPCLNKR